MSEQKTRSSEPRVSGSARGAFPASPCISLCTLDDDKRCLGCGRTLDQISRWALMSKTEQWAVIDELKARDMVESG